MPVEAYGLQPSGHTGARPPTYVRAPEGACLTHSQTPRRPLPDHCIATPRRTFPIAIAMVSRPSPTPGSRPNRRRSPFWAHVSPASARTNGGARGGLLLCQPAYAGWPPLGPTADSGRQKRRRPPRTSRAAFAVVTRDERWVPPYGVSSGFPSRPGLATHRLDTLPRWANCLLKAAVVRARRYALPSRLPEAAAETQHDHIAADAVMLAS